MKTDFSAKLAAMQPSMTLAITQKAAEMRAAGRDVISLSAGEPDFAPPAAVAAAASAAIAAGVGKYTAVAGSPDARAAVCEKLARENGLNYSADEIIISCGAKHSLFNAVFALLNPGDEVIIPAPYWVTYPEQVRLAGGEAVVLQPDASTLKITPEQLRAAITPRTKALVLNNPSNPSGAMYTKAELAALAAVLEGTNVWVIADEIYEHLRYDGAEFCAFAALSQDAYLRTITINGLSKCAAMPGWRFGYSACANAELNALMRKLQGQVTSNISAITQAAAIAALRGDADADLAAMRAEFERRRDLAYEHITQIKGIKAAAKPAGAFYIFADCSAICSDDLKFCADVLEHAGVALVPGSAFGMRGYFRLSYATSAEQIAKALERLKAYCDAL